MHSRKVPVLGFIESMAVKRQPDGPKSGYRKKAPENDLTFKFREMRNSSLVCGIDQINLAPRFLGIFSASLLDRWITLISIIRNGLSSVFHSTVTLLARFRGLSTSVPHANAV